MEPLKQHTGVVAPLDLANVDTDQIIPKQFLKKIERTGFGRHLFHDWRYEDEEETREISNFVLNEPAYRNASVLLARENFGCGSSREHAPWALHDFGFRVIVAPSFADIFYNNCFKNGMLPLVLKTEEVDSLFRFVRENHGATLTADLDGQTVEMGDLKYNFSIDPFRKETLLNGWDDIGLTLRNSDKIDSFEQSYFEEMPYLKPAV